MLCREVSAERNSLFSHVGVFNHHWVSERYAGASLPTFVLLKIK